MPGGCLLRPQAEASSKSTRRPARFLNELAAPVNLGVNDGLAFDGVSLWFLGGSFDPNTLYQLNPNTGRGNQELPQAEKRLPRWARPRAERANLHHALRRRKRHHRLRPHHWNRCPDPGYRRAQPRRRFRRRPWQLDGLDVLLRDGGRRQPDLQDRSLHRPRPRLLHAESGRGRRWTGRLGRGNLHRQAHRQRSLRLQPVRRPGSQHHDSRDQRNAVPRGREVRLGITVSPTSCA